MATVFLAHDLRHDRDVAIKVLKPELAAVLGADRFVQEIRTTAALSHPHILPLFDSGEAGGLLWYAMPFIDGETLRDKLNRETQLPVDEAVRTTREVADALDYAHRHGVVHRDIKPENILLHDGRPMVADFGIALAVSAAAGGRMTETGLSLGTPHYMSPEQATADKEITGRSDIYSLASVCYEMLTGNPPHTGSSAQQIIMKIVAEEAAPVTKYRKSVPANVAAAVAKGLEKLPADRFATAREFAEALANPGFTTMMTGAVSASPTTARVARHPLVAALATALLLAIGFGGYAWTRGGGSAVDAVVRFHVDVPATERIATMSTGPNLAVSRDGETVGFILVSEAGIPHVYVRRIEGESAHLVEGTDGAQTMCFSWDGRWIAYLRGTEIWRVRIEGGTPVRVGTVSSIASGMTWTSTNELLVGGPDLAALPVGGGERRVLLSIDGTAGETYFGNPILLPDEKTVLFSIQSTGGFGGSRLAAVPLAGGEAQHFDVSATLPLGYVDGAVIVVTPAGAIQAVRLDLGNGRISGEPLALGATALSTAVGGSAAAALSPTGTLVYQVSNAEGTLGWVDREGRFRAVLQEPQRYGYPRLSPDGRHMVYTIAIGQRSDVWVADTAATAPTRMTNTAVTSDRPEWSPDGRRVLYRVERNQRSAILWQAYDLTGSVEALLESDTHDYYEAVLSPDGTRVAYQLDDGGAQQADVLQRTLGDPDSERPIANTLAIEMQPRISPDGRWVAYVAEERGWQVFVRPFPGPGERVQVSVAGGQEPVWSPDGSRLYYRDGRHLIAASFAPSGGFVITGRTAVFEDPFTFGDAPHANYDVSRDGRFLMVRGTRDARLQVVHNWLGEFRTRLRQEESP